jgi:hypothetical protein
MSPDPLARFTRIFLFARLFSKGFILYGRQNLTTEEDPPGSMTYLQSFGPGCSGSEGALPVTAGRAKRENGGLGEDPPGSMITY